ncbi:MAG: hypothetical protein ACREXR_00820 [Gammaproteobacteria bacterium]
MAVMDYRTQDGLVDYAFSIEFQQDVGWRVYIIFQPFRQGNDDSLQLPHRSIDRTGRHYVNWSSRLDSLGDARTVAALWAELIQRYEGTKKQRRPTLARRDRFGDAVGVSGAVTGHQQRDPVIPLPR